MLRSEDACQKRFSWFLDWNQKLRKCSRLDSKGANVYTSCRSRQELSNEYLVLTCKLWRRYSRERASQFLPKISRKLEKNKVRKNIGLDVRPVVLHDHSRPLGQAGFLEVFKLLQQRGAVVICGGLHLGGTFCRPRT